MLPSTTGVNVQCARTTAIIMIIIIWRQQKRGKSNESGARELKRLVVTLSPGTTTQMSGVKIQMHVTKKCKPIP